MNTYVVLAGPSGAGKTEGAKVLAEFLAPAVVLTYSSFMKAEVQAQGKPVTGQTIRDHSLKQLATWGPHYWTDQLLDSVKDLKDTTIIIDGVRIPSMMERLKQTDCPIRIIGFLADEETRFQRVKARKRDLEAMSDEQLKAWLKKEMRDDPKSGFQIQKCLDRANFLVDGNQPFESVREQLQEIAQAIKRV